MDGFAKRSFHWRSGLTIRGVRHLLFGSAKQRLTWAHGLVTTTPLLGNRRSPDMLIADHFSDADFYVDKLSGPKLSGPDLFGQLQ